MELFLLAGGAAIAAAYLVGIACVRTFAGLLVLAALGAVAAVAVHALGPQTELVRAAADANFLGWLAGVFLVARLRAIEWLDPQEAA